MVGFCNLVGTDIAPGSKKNAVKAIYKNSNFILLDYLNLHHIFLIDCHNSRSPTFAAQ